MARPHKALALLRRLEVSPTRQLCSAVPAGALGDVVPQLLAGLSTEQITGVLAPLINRRNLLESLVALLGVLDSASMVTVLSSVPEDAGRLGRSELSGLL